MEQVETLTHRNLTAYLMEAGQDLTVRHRMVFDVQGREVARLESQRECCAYCCYSHSVEIWGKKRLVCGDPTQATCVDVAPDGWCKFYEGPAPDLGLTMDIWY